MAQKKLVAYFSATGTTRAAAQKLAAAAGADLFEIRPAQPYTAADLDWTNKRSRSTLEMNDPASRPAIAGKLDNMGDYETIFLGFPIWWYTVPAIVRTFLESYDLSGRTVVPFATSGGSGLGRSAKELATYCSARILPGKMLTGASDGEIRSWAASLRP